jgi:hypothetical protein
LNGAKCRFGDPFAASAIVTNPAILSTDPKESAEVAGLRYVSDARCGSAAYAAEQHSAISTPAASRCAMPARIRKTVAEDLQLPGLPRRKVLAAVVRLLDTTFIRVGNGPHHSAQPARHNFPLHRAAALSREKRHATRGGAHRPARRPHASIRP